MKSTAKMVVATIVALSIAAGCGDTVYVVSDTTDIPEENASSAATEAPKKTTTTKPSSPRPSASVSPAPSTSSYDPEGYDSAIWAEANDFWWLFSTEDLLTMGLLVCEELDRGTSIESITQQIVNAMVNTNTAYLSTGMATMAAAAIMYLCPEHNWVLSTL